MHNLCKHECVHNYVLYLLRRTTYSLKSPRRPQFAQVWVRWRGDQDDWGLHFAARATRGSAELQHIQVGRVGRIRVRTP